jgi:hypothetical protein
MGFTNLILGILSGTIAMTGWLISLKLDAIVDAIREAGRR